MYYFETNGTKYRYRSKLARVCELYAAWYEPVKDPKALVDSLTGANPQMHIFSFFQLVPHTKPMYSYNMDLCPFAVIETDSFENWQREKVGKKTRYMIRKAEKAGIQVRTVDFNDDLVKGISRIYNETPVRQEKQFPHYNDSLERVRSENGTYVERSVFLGAFLEDELVGFCKVVMEPDFADILQLLSKISFQKNGVMNALVAEAVRVSTARGYRYICYGDWDDTGLTDFKRHNGFERMDLPRYFIPLTLVGKLMLKLGFHKPIRQLVPAGALRLLKALRRRALELRLRLSKNPAS